MSSESLSPIDRYAQEVPRDIRRATESLSGNEEYAVIVYLLKEGDKSFTQIKEEFDFHQNTLSRVLSKLQRGGLILRRETVEKGERYDAKYTVTSFAKRVFDGLFDSVQPSDRGLEPSPTFESVLSEGLAAAVYEDVRTKETSGTEISDVGEKLENEASVNDMMRGGA